jgi:hypothetical protein
MRQYQCRAIPLWRIYYPMPELNRSIIKPDTTRQAITLTIGKETRGLPALPELAAMRCTIRCNIGRLARPTIQTPRYSHTDSQLARMDPSWHFYDPQPQSSASVARQSYSRATMKSPLSTCINANKLIDKERMIMISSEESPRTSKPAVQLHSIPRSPSYVQHDFSRQPSRLLSDASQKKPEYTNRGSVPLQEESLESSVSPFSIICRLRNVESLTVTLFP